MSSKSKLDINHCNYNNSHSLNDPELYYINLKTSQNRNHTISQLLNKIGIKYHRIEALTSNTVYIPSDLLIKSKRYKRVYQPNLLYTTTKYINKYRGCIYQSKENLNITINNAKQQHKQYIVNGICTRDITLSELYCTMSHLLAIYTAVNSPTASSKYALITEDDIHIPYDIDYTALALSAPTDFGILQLYTSYPPLTNALWDEYEKNPRNFWTARNTNYYWGMFKLYTYIHFMYILLDFTY